jgi:hypothetical protein
VKLVAGVSDKSSAANCLPWISAEDRPLVVWAAAANAMNKMAARVINGAAK